MLKKLIAVSIAAVLGMSLISSGCSSKTVDTDKSATSNSETGKIGNQEEIAYPIVKDKLALKGQGRWTGAEKYIKDFNDNIVFQEMEKKTNIHIDWSYFSLDNFNEQVGLMFASKQLPDFINCLTMDQAKEYGGKGALIVLNELIDKYAPNFKAYLKRHPDVEKRIKDGSGKIYAIPLCWETEKATVWRSFMVRNDWLKTLGMKVPETTDDWYKMLRAFKDNEEKLSPGQKIIPFSSWQSTGVLDSTVNVFSWSWGLMGVGNNGGLYQKGGKVYFAPLQPEFREVLRYLNRLYKEGLLDPDLDTIKDNPQYDAKMTNNRIGSAFLGNGKLALYNTNMKDKVPGFELIPVMPPKGPAGQYGFGEVDIPDNHLWCFSISYSNKNPVETIKWFDYVFSDEGKMLYNYGKEGDTYIMKDGKPQLTEKLLNNPQYTITTAPLVHIAPQYNSAHLRMLNEQVAGPVVTEYRNSLEQKGYTKEGVTVMKLSYIPMLKEENSQYSAMSSDIETYIP